MFLRILAKFQWMTRASCSERRRRRRTVHEAKGLSIWQLPETEPENLNTNDQKKLWKIEYFTSFDFFSVNGRFWILYKCRRMLCPCTNFILSIFTRNFLFYIILYLPSGILLSEIVLKILTTKKKNCLFIDTVYLWLGSSSQVSHYHYTIGERNFSHLFKQKNGFIQ
jgi:hypothetical protein